MSTFRTLKAQHIFSAIFFGGALTTSMPVLAESDDGKKFNVRPIIGLTSTMLEGKEEGLHIAEIDDAYNPFNNINGIDVGFTLWHEDYPIVLSAKTNRFATIKNVKSGKLFLNDRELGDATVERRTTTGTLVLTYVHPYARSVPVLPYISYSKNKSENDVDFRGIKSEKDIEDYYWGPGVFIPFNKELTGGATFTYVLENDDAGTKNGFNVSIFTSFDTFKF